MAPEITQLLQKNNILSHSNMGITVCTVSDNEAGVRIAKDLLYEVVNPQTALYLSGGKTPQSLYEQFAVEGQLKAGAVGLVDERFGEKFHAKSNEKMIRETDFLQYLETSNMPFYPILQKDMDRKATAVAYDEQERSLHSLFPRSVAILGIGTDGHTSGIAPNRSGFTNPLFAPEQKDLFVSEFFDPKSFYGERISTTFLGLSMMDVLIVLAFGKDKQKALTTMFESGSEKVIPARFYKRPEIASKTILITDRMA